MNTEPESEFKDGKAERIVAAIFYSNVQLSEDFRKFILIRIDECPFPPVILHDT